MITYISRMLAIFLCFQYTTAIHADTLYLGSVGVDPDEEIKEFHSLATYLQKHLNHSKIDKVTVVVASNSKEMANLITNNKVHLYIDSPFPSLVVQKESGSSIFLRRWKKGVAEYRSVIFTRKDSGINTLEAMKGHVLAFEDPFSTSSYFLPKATLATKNLVLKQVNSGENVDKNSVGYLFSDDDRNTMLWVLRKKVSIGTMNETSYKRLAKKRLNDLQVIASSIWVPRHVVSHAPGMKTDLVEAIKKTLIQMHESEEGKSALKGFANTTGFDEFPGGVKKHLEPLAPLMKYR